jgi:hypothetical protein
MVTGIKIGFRFTKVSNFPLITKTASGKPETVKSRGGGQY